MKVSVYAAPGVVNWNRGGNSVRVSELIFYVNVRLIESISLSRDERAHS